MNLIKECLFNMSIQSSINTLVGSLGAVKRSNDFGIRQKAMQELKQQQMAKQTQRLELRQKEAELLGKKLEIREYEAKNVRKQLNIEAKKLREESK